MTSRRSLCRTIIAGAYIRRRSVHRGLSRQQTALGSVGGRLALEHSARCGPLTTATSTQLSVAFEREFWVPTDASSGPAPKLRLGGLSGGPNETGPLTARTSGSRPRYLEQACRRQHRDSPSFRHYTTADGYNPRTRWQETSRPIPANCRSAPGDAQQEDQNRKKERHCSPKSARAQKASGRNGTAGAQSAQLIYFGAGLRHDFGNISAKVDGRSWVRQTLRHTSPRRSDVPCRFRTDEAGID